eukprot:m.97294 g.97294  ORF g.97294 m.97294 type:complete len:61 (-) comp26963_c1_seq1:86-268(-)
MIIIGVVGCGAGGVLLVMVVLLVVAGGCGGVIPVVRGGHACVCIGVVFIFGGGIVYSCSL